MRVPDSTEGSLVVRAGVHRVLTVVADVAAYPGWNQEVSAAEVLDAGPEGRPRLVRMTLESPQLRDSFDLLYAWHEPPGPPAPGASWTLAREGTVLRRMDGAYALRALDAQRTEVTYRLRVGVSIPLIGPLRHKAEKTVIDRALGGLRQRVEDTTWD